MNSFIPQHKTGDLVMVFLFGKWRGGVVNKALWLECGYVYFVSCLHVTVVLSDGDIKRGGYF